MLSCTITTRMPIDFNSWAHVAKALLFDFVAMVGAPWSNPNGWSLRLNTSAYQLRFGASAQSVHCSIHGRHVADVTPPAVVLYRATAGFVERSQGATVFRTGLSVLSQATMALISSGFMLWR